jgi:hypothetical protein
MNQESLQYFDELSRRPPKSAAPLRFSAGRASLIVVVSILAVPALLSGILLDSYLNGFTHAGRVCSDLIDVEGFEKLLSYDAGREGTASAYWLGPGGSDPLAVVHVRDLRLEPFDGGGLGVFETVAVGQGPVLDGDYGMSVWVLVVEAGQRTNEGLLSRMGLSAQQVADLAAGRSDLIEIEWRCRRR